MRRGFGYAGRLRLCLAAAGLLALMACGKTPAPAPAPAAAGAAKPVAAAAVTSKAVKVAPAPAPKGDTPASADAKGKAPRIEVAKTTVDVGDVTRGEKAVHTFILKNVGTDVLRIAKAKSS